MSKIPHPYQNTAIELGKSRNMMLLDDRGLGKTLCCVEIGKSAVGFPKLVICNKTARAQWKDEILDQCPDAEVLILDKISKGSRFQRDCWIIIHYWVASAFKKYLSESALYGAVFIDEAHRIKNRQTDISKSIHKIESLRKVAVSGTPIEHGPRDFWSSLNWLYPNQYRSLWDFVKKHCELKKQWTPNGIKNVTTGRCIDPARLAREIAPFSIRRMKSEVAPWLPPKRIFRIPVEMESNQRKLYDFIDSVEDIEAVDDDGEYHYLPNQMAKLTRLHQIASNPAILNRNGESAKLLWVDDYLRDNPNTRCIIVSRYKSNANMMAHRYNAAIVVGGHEEGLDEFKSGSVKHLVGTIAALGESHSLPMADCVICVDQDYNSILMDQVIDRHHRTNTTAQKDVIMLFIPGTVDDLVLKCIDEKLSENELIYEFMKGYQKQIPQTKLALDK